MEVAIIPNWVIKYISKDHLRQNDFNVLISSSIIILLFLIFKNSLICFLGHVPHFCLIDKIIGVECPVCGTTRALCELSNGNISKAYLLNPTSVFVALFFVLQVPLRIISLTNKNKTKSINILSKYFSRSVLIIILLSWIINLFIFN